MEPRTWTRHEPSTKQTYLISTRREYVSIPFVNSAFSHPDMSWAKPLSEASTQLMLDNSLTFGVYVTSPPTADQIYQEMRQVGMARLITDYVTFAYLTDVFVEEGERRKGLAGWLARCCQEVVEGMGEGFRRSFLMVGSHVEERVRFYGKHMKMHVPEQDREKGVFMTWKKGT